MAPATAAAVEPDCELPVLVIFDFDQSLVDDDSDIFVFQQLAPALLPELRARWHHEQWTQLIDALLQQLVQLRPELTAADIERTVARIPAHARMLDAVRLAAQTHAAHVHIVSDANTVFIESVLAHHGLTSLIRHVHTNPAAFEPATPKDVVALNDNRSNRLRVTWYHSADVAPHGCAYCPVNMCKGAIVDALRRTRAYKRVLYVGDGKGDFCPTTRLTSDDVVLAREGDDPYHGTFELLNAIKLHRADVQARVVPWRTGDDVLAYFHALFESKATMPFASVPAPVAP